MRIGCEMGEWDFRKIGRTLSNEDLDRWAAFFRLQKKEVEKDQQDATAAREEARAAHRAGLLT